jgi:hypothetical protein
LFLVPPGTIYDSSRFCSKFSSLSNVLFLRKPWRSRPSEPWPTTTIDHLHSPYKHIGQLLLSSTSTIRLGGIF